MEHQSNDRPPIPPQYNSQADNNPYQVGQYADSLLNTTINSANTFALLSTPNQCSASDGVEWIRQAFAIFKQNIWLWIGMSLVVVILSLIPYIGSIVSLFTSFFIAGMVFGCNEQVQGRQLKFEHLFQGFITHLKPLLILLLVYIAIAVVMAIIMVILTVLVIPFVNPDKMFLVMVLIVLAALAVSIPFIMAMWFAPALIMLHDVKPIQAMKMSFQGCMKNMLPFLVYGLVIFFVGSLFTILTLGLGLLVLIPISYIVMYVSYVNVWTDYSLEA